MALYEAKRLGKGRHATYRPGMHQQTPSRFSLAEQLRHAINSDELAMHFQPIVDLASTHVVGFEALMRWRHPDRGWVPPNVFIPLAEQSDLILELGQLALHEALGAASSWPQATSSNAPPFVTVNLSARQFQDSGLIALVERELAASGLEANRLIVEITEGVALLEIVDTLRVIQHLRSIGVGVALDNFGTGFSSLSHLSQLNPMMIKIDQSFVRPTRASLHNDRLLETMVSIGRNLEMDMLAEGIETQAQLEQLRELRCSLGQGFLFSPAVPYEETIDLVGRIFQS
jgi:EAL domain-containing protein (putative c-di-GMP-specific phosphodiesterase class I)